MCNHIDESYLVNYEVETKDLCTMRNSSTSKKGLQYFMALKLAGFPDFYTLTDYVKI
jgi:hypothetical protein